MTSGPVPKTSTVGCLSCSQPHVRVMRLKPPGGKQFEYEYVFFNEKTGTCCATLRVIYPSSKVCKYCSKKNKSIMKKYTKRNFNLLDVTQL